VGGCHLIEEATSLDEELPNIGAGEFGDDAASLGVDVERGRRLERLDQQTLSCGRGIADDVGNGIIEHLTSVLGPDYAPTLRSHFRRMALSTSS
jgi:hypothetical protein